MELHDFINLVANKRKTILGVIAIFLVLGVGVIAVQRFKYSSKSQVLVVQEYNQNVDSYTASKSNEYLSSVLASVISSNSFYDKVMNSSFNINSAYFGTTPKDQMKEWQRTVDAKNIGDSGIISITVYHPDRAEAEKIVRATTYVLMTQHAAYDGTSEAVKIRLIDQPITSNYPVRPNIPVILGLALGLGLVCGLLIVYLNSANEFYNHENYHEVNNKINNNLNNNLNNVRSTNYLAHEQIVNDQPVANKQVSERSPEVHSAKAHTPYGNKAVVPPESIFQAEPEGDYLLDEDVDLGEETTFQGNIRNILN